jgi:hypothetical protein
VIPAHNKGATPESSNLSEICKVYSSSAVILVE